MIRKTTLLVFLALAVTALVAGCGGGSQEGGQGSQESESEQGQAGGSSEGGETTAAMEGGLNEVARFQEPIYGTSFVSPLAEIFGDISIENGRSWRGTRC